MTRELTEAAQVAKILRTELKKQYPQYKFTVKSRNFAGGDAVDVNAIDIPPEHAKPINALVRQYMAGHFNGMEDIYEYDKDKTGLTAKYTHFHNRMSETLKQAIIRYCEATFGDFKDGYNPHDYRHTQQVSEIFSNHYGDCRFSKEFWGQWKAQQATLKSA